MKMTLKPYKCRNLDINKPVMIYKNLTNGLWSVKQGGFVVGHCSEFLMRSTGFRVVESTRRRVVAEKKKYVHAYIIGFLFQDFNNIILSSHFMDGEIKYNPYRRGCFYSKDVLGNETDLDMEHVSLVYGSDKIVSLKPF